jgi:hypothetical protein
VASKIGLGPTVTIARKSGAAALAARMAGLSKLAAYVGVPASGRGARSTQLLSMAGNVKGAYKRAKLAKAARGDVNNAELLFIHTNGSPLKNIPARPVLQPAIQADGNKEKIAREIQASIKASLDGDKAGAEKFMGRAALAGQNAARLWFTDSRNGWAKNAKRTIARKGSDRPLIDTGALRAAIIGIVKEE